MDAQSTCTHSPFLTRYHATGGSVRPPRSTAAGSPVGWSLYRFGLILGGLAWIFVASTFCGCRAASGWMMNESGKGYYQAGHYTAARYEFERALIDDPYNPTYAYNLARTLQKEGNYMHSEQLFQHALRLDPSHQLAYHGLSELLISQGRQDDARQLLHAWAETQPYLPEPHIELARYQQRMGDYAGAEQRLHQALRINPYQPQAIGQMGQLYQQTGRPQMAAAYYQQSLMMNPLQPDVSSQLNHLHLANRPSPSMQMVQTMPRMDPTLMGGMPGMGGMYGPQMHMATPPMHMHSAPTYMSAPPVYMNSPGVPMQGLPQPTPATSEAVSGMGWGPAMQHVSHTTVVPSTPHVSNPVHGPVTHYVPPMPQAAHMHGSQPHVMQVHATGFHNAVQQPVHIMPQQMHAMEYGAPVQVPPASLPMMSTAAPAINAF